MRDNIIETVIGVFWVVLFLYLEFFGLFHAFKSHGKDDGITAIFIPPMAWYRAVEFWWHDDFRGVDWSKRTDEDARLVASILNASVENDPDSRRKSIEAIEFMNERKKNYPKEQLQEIEELAQSYGEFLITLVEDLKTHYETHAADVYMPQYKPSFELGRIVSRFDKYPEMRSMTQLNVDAIQLIFKERVSLAEEDEIESALQSMDLARTNMIQSMSSTFEKLFGKPARFSPQNLPETPHGTI